MHKAKVWLFLTVLLIISTVTAACTAPAEPASPAESLPAATATPVVEQVVTPAAAGEIQDGGTLNYAYPQKFSPYGSFNPLNAPAGVQAELFRMIYNRLVSWNVGASEVIPELAESWEFSEDQTKLIYKLRQDVTWHDGTPFTAADVEFTYKLALWPNMPSTAAEQLMSIVGAREFRDGASTEIPGITVVDDYTIEFTSTEPDAAVYLNSAIISILPKHLLESGPLDDPEAFGQLDFFLKQPIGTGPFKVDNYVEDQYVEFVRNESYFRGSPHIEKINWLILSGSDVIPAGLEDGSIDITANTPAADLERFIDNPDFSIYWQPTAVYCSIAVNFNRPFLTPQVLQGIAHAIDRETLVQEFLGQTAQVWDTPLGHAWLLPNPDLKPYNYDPVLAKQLLEEGGWDFANQKLQLKFAGADPANVVVFIADNLQKAGINVEMVSAGTGAAANEIYYVTMDWDLYWGCNSWGFDPDSTAIYYRSDSTYADGKGWNTGGWSDVRLDELYDLGRTTLDQATRKAYYQEAQLIFNERLPKIVIYRSIRPWVIRNTIHDATPQYHGELPNYNAIETWWMDQ
ncbi:MAG: ABC transporter substrate-binding protein [Caldilineaceae bacterium]|nr:ABC transporter substrate-binding protein [Caldilineaceae bacterium]